MYGAFRKGGGCGRDWYLPCCRPPCPCRSLRRTPDHSSFCMSSSRSYDVSLRGAKAGCLIADSTWRCGQAYHTDSRCHGSDRGWDTSMPGGLCRCTCSKEARRYSPRPASMDTSPRCDRSLLDQSERAGGRQSQNGSGKCIARARRAMVVVVMVVFASASPPHL